MRRSRSLERAYRATVYRVRLPRGECVLRVGKRNPRLDEWLKAQGFGCWSIITAWNPASRQLSARQNRRRQRVLHAQLLIGGCQFFAAENRAVDGNWPVEPSFFVPALPPGEAARLAKQLGQNAFLWGVPGKAARLCWRPTIPH